MNRPPKTKLVVALGGALLAFSALSVYAAGLGKLSVSSALGQPLSAEIELVSLQPGEFEAITARVASPESYGEARIEYTPLLRQLRFATERRANGTPLLKIASSAPINEPFLDVLVEMNWPAGRLLREYPILLDPPGFNEARIAAPVADVAVVKPSVSVPSPAATISGSPSAKTEAAGDTYGPVKRGDTLSKIATEMKSDTVSLEQMLVALYRENKAAFVDNNMNRLRTGQILRVPSASEVASVSANEARGEIKVQVANWNAYREQVAGSVASSQPKAATNAATGKITVAKPDIPTPATAPKDQLKIAKTDGVPGKVGNAGASGGAQDQVNALKEEKIARENALKEANSRVADLEKQIATMRKLAEVKGLAAPAPVDTKVAAKPEEKVPPKVEAKTPASPATPVPAPVVETKVAQITPPVATPDSSKTPPKADAKPGEVVPPAAKSDAVVAAKPANVKPAAPKKAAPPPAPDFIDEYGLIAGAGGAALIGIGGLLFFMSRRKKKGPSSNTSMSRTSSIMPSDLKPNTVTGNKGGGLVDTGNSSFLTDFDKTGPGSIDTDEVDPLAEADVYIAYGRDAQAEEILKEALGRDKSRHEITLKLLEIYHNRKSAQAFETVAREFKDSVGEGSPHWAKAAAMGAAIDPQNPLYSGSGAAYATTGAFAAGGAALAASAEGSAESASPPDLDFDLGFSDSATPSSAIDISAPNSDQPVSGGGSDFDLDLGTTSGPAAHADIGLKPDEGSGMDFDLALDTPVAHAAPVAAPIAAPIPEASSFDFDLSALSLDEPSHSETIKMAAVPQAQPPKSMGAPSKSSSFGDLSLDLDGPAETGGTDSGAAATKLELAKAYVEIGDSDGAKEILNEVMREGNAGQQAEAKKLIAGL
ncbi:MAG: FimV/HubP family polar landmark protein [Betaproteobacteria bacterium]